MEPNLNKLNLFLALVAFWVLTQISIDLIATWALFQLQEFRDVKRPRFNLKEL